MAHSTLDEKPGRARKNSMGNSPDNKGPKASTLRNILSYSKALSTGRSAWIGRYELVLN